MFESSRILSKTNQTSTAETTTTAKPPTTMGSTFTENIGGTMTSESSSDSDKFLSTTTESASTNSDHSTALYVGIASGVVIVLLVASVAFLVFRLKKVTQTPTKAEEAESKDDTYEEVGGTPSEGEETKRDSYQDLIKAPYLTVLV